jgi:hypothetical protein
MLTLAAQASLTRTPHVQRDIMRIINLRMRPPAVHNTHEVQGNYNPISTRALLYLFMGGIVLTSLPRTFSKTHPQHTYRSCKVSGHACCRVVSSVMRVSKGRPVRHRAAFSESGLRSFSRATIARVANSANLVAVYANPMVAAVNANPMVVAVYANHII